MHYLIFWPAWKIILKYLIKTKFKYFITNNTFLNNIYIIRIINLIHSNLNAKEKKLRYIRYIIKLINKTFIFGNLSEFFKANIIITKSTNNLKITIKFWKK